MTKTSQSTSRRAAFIIAIAAATFGTAVSARSAFPNGPIIKQPTEPGTPIVYPDCHSPMFVVQKGAHIFRCRLIAPTPKGGLLPIAMSTDQCAPNAYWNDGPSMAITPAGVGMTAYTITCKHN